MCGPQAGYPLLLTGGEDGCIRCWDLSRGRQRAAMHSARSTWPNVVDGCLKGLCVVTQLTSYILTLPLAWPKVGSHCASAAAGMWGLTHARGACVCVRA